MSMSWDCNCKKCGREFSAWAPHNLCNDCEEFAAIKDLPPTHRIRVSNQMGKTYMFAEDLRMFGDMNVSLNDPDFSLILYQEEIQALQNHLGRKIIF